MQYGSRNFSLSEIIRGVGEGRIALPEFQRDFVWDPNRVVELLDSVANGWPIGSLLVLNGPQPFEVKDINGGPRADRATVGYYLLDGQQRVTALYHAFTNSGEYEYFLDVNLWMELGQSGIPDFQWKSKNGKRELAIGQVLLRDFLDRKRFSEVVENSPSSMSAALNKVRSLRFRQFLQDQYSVPAIVLASDIDLEAMTRIFETLNRGGEKLDAFDLMVAVLYPHKFQLRDEFSRARDEFPRLVTFETDGIEVLKLIALWQRDADERSKSRPSSRRVTGVRQKDVLNIPPVDVSRLWGRALVAYDAALAFLEVNGGVTSASSLPSTAMVLTLGYFLDANRTKAELESWYWNAIALQSYAQGANTQVLSDIDRPTQADRGAAMSAVEVGANDFARRNRILRLGLAGLTRVEGARDIYSGEELKVHPREFSVAQVVEGKTRPAASELIRDLAFVSPASLTSLRKEIRLDPGSLLLRLDHEALKSQGFSFDQLGAISSATRPSVLASWLGSRL